MNEIKPTPFISKALTEVWEWKNRAYSDTRHLTDAQLHLFYHNELEKAAALMNCDLVKNADGSYSFKQK
jgi:hypothetical protein